MSNNDEHTQPQPTLRLDDTDVAQDTADLAQDPATDKVQDAAATSAVDNSESVSKSVNYAGIVWGLILIVVGGWAVVQMYYASVLTTPWLWLAAAALIGVVLLIAGFAGHLHKRDKQ